YLQTLLHELDTYTLPTRRSSDLTRRSPAFRMSSAAPPAEVWPPLNRQTAFEPTAESGPPQTHSIAQRFLFEFFRRPYVAAGTYRSEEHTSELQSHLNLVCRLLLE